MEKEFENEFESESVVIIKRKASIISKVAITLMILSFAFYGIIPVIPFLALTTTEKSMAVPAVMISGELIWWIGVAMVGKQAAFKYKKYLNPCNWFFFSKKLENSEY